MILRTIILAAYGLLLLVGGIMGHQKANSLPSLIMGTISALLVLASAVAVYKGQSWGDTLSLTISAILTMFFSYRFLLTFRFMPSGMMALISLGIFLFLMFSHQSEK